MKEERNESKCGFINSQICEGCIYYPPSSLDGKPCCICDTSDPLLNCYCEREG